MKLGELGDYLIRLGVTILVIAIIGYYINRYEARMYDNGIMTGAEFTQERNMRDELNDIITCFHLAPNYDDFKYLYDNRTQLLKSNPIGSKFWLWGVYMTHPEYFDNDTMTLLDSWFSDILKTLRRYKLRPRPAHLEAFWGLYFATGDTNYADIVKHCALFCKHADARNSAMWSYTEIMGTAPRVATDVDIDDAQAGAGLMNADFMGEMLIEPLTQRMF
ncbi:hypothetical protein F-S17_0120 [Faustovirus]|nr:hypothetical protein F-LCD7_0135 [Faustovirus]QJX71898.1 hypothetical protein F-M6_0135 [Faustovirus]QJX72386.1 hypothetical protein F-S17_0120 [Faustovirus]QJX72896.1 hypothetical protein F-VV57_0134 [Faustovirus]QJX73401.1 hypothetical protein F-VV63_0135 [Faustovirus]